MAQKDLNVLDSIEDVLIDIKQGKPIILVDDLDRENEGDLVLSAQFATKEKINFLISNAKGLLCAPLGPSIAKKLQLSLMTIENTEPNQTAFTFSIDSKDSTTGISAGERAHTLNELTKKNITIQDFVYPGHIFPLLAKKDGVLERTGHTEGSIDLMKFAGLPEAACIIEIIKDDGDMARLPDLIEMKKKYNIKLTSIEALVAYRQTHDFPIILDEVAKAQLPTDYGFFDIVAFDNNKDHKEHIVLTKGDFQNQNAPLVRIHSECFTGDLLHSLRCDCGNQLKNAMQMIEKEGSGLLLYLRQEGRGIGLFNKIKAYSLQEKGYDTVEANEKLGFKAEERDFSIAVAILKHYGIKKVRLLTNNPLKIKSLEKEGIEVIHVPSVVNYNKYNEKYMKTKKEKMNHLLSNEDLGK